MNPHSSRSTCSSIIVLMEHVSSQHGFDLFAGNQKEVPSASWRCYLARTTNLDPKYMNKESSLGFLFHTFTFSTFSISFLPNCLKLRQDICIRIRTRKRKKKSRQGTKILRMTVMKCSSNLFYHSAEWGHRKHEIGVDSNLQGIGTPGMWGTKEPSPQKC
jgi:hypothetical protein